MDCNSASSRSRCSDCSKVKGAGCDNGGGEGNVGGEDNGAGGAFGETFRGSKGIGGTVLNEAAVLGLLKPWVDISWGSGREISWASWREVKWVSCGLAERAGRVILEQSM